MARPQVYIEDDYMYCDQDDWYIELPDSIQDMNDAVNSFVRHIEEFHSEGQE